MRESRTYGSVRGAYDETHVPTATGDPVPLARFAILGQQLAGGAAAGAHGRRGDRALKPFGQFVA
jgi:hypothetical protein